MPPVFGIIISKRLATYKELREDYTYLEALELLDVIMTDNYNQQVISENNNG